MLFLRQKSPLLANLTLALLAILLITALVAASPMGAAMRAKLLCATETGNCVEGWNSTDVTLYSDAGSTQTLNLDGALGHIDTEGNITLADYLVIEPQTAISVTNAGVITPTGSYQPLESAGPVTATLAACSTAGRVYWFINTVNQTITISDTGNTVMSNNAALGQYDALTMLCDGTRLIQVAPESDN